jgi:hypothetical protein
MAKVNIIIRAFNRLEYTVLTVREIDRLAGFDDYKMIIIDQASTDGTGLWLKSLEKEGYYKIKPIYLTENVGDFGGTKVGYDNLDDDCEYTMQWDNDCPPLTPSFLANIVDIMDNHQDIGQLMLKRDGVSTKIIPTNKQEYKGIIFGDVHLATCVNIQRRKVVEEINSWIVDESQYWDFNLNNEIRKRGFKIKKCDNIMVKHLDVFVDDFNSKNTLNKQIIKFPEYTKRKGNDGKISFNTVNYNNL